MEIKRIRALRGPNLWSRRTAVEAIVHIGDTEHVAADVPGLKEATEAAFGREATAWFDPEKDLPPTLAHILGRVALALQVRAGCPVSFLRTSRAVEKGVHQVVVEYRDEEVGRRALAEAENFCRAAAAGASFDVDAAVTALSALDEEIRLGPSTGSIVQAALDRGIPVRRLNEASLVQLGWGARQRRILAAETDRTSAIAEAIAQDKHLTKILIEAVGVPVPEGRPVSDAGDAVAAAMEIGFPVVVKPRHGNQGRGVAVDLRTPEQVVAAYAVARQVEEAVLVERYAPGGDFRLLVVGGRLVAAARREPPQVVGDGRRTVRELVDEVNADPRRTAGHATSLSRIRIDDTAVAVLATQGYNPDSVVPAGTRVVLRGNANLSTGGTATDVTDEVHPDVAACAVDAAAAVGLDVCGVDVVTRTVGRPLREQGGVVVEVNAAPGLRMHLDPSYGEGRPVGRAIVDWMFGPGENGRIPIAAVSGTNGKTTTVRMVAHILRASGLRVGMTCSDGIYIDGRRIEEGDCSGPRSARAVLANPTVEAAVFETARGGILREGLAFDRCDVGVVTNIGTGDHLGLNYIRSVEDLAVLKRVIVQNVAPSGTAVLNAEDPLVAAMAGECEGQVAFFAHDPSHPVLASHRAAGGRVIFVEDFAIVAAQGTFSMRLPFSAVPLTRGGTVPFQVDNAMCAIAAAWSLGVPWDAIAAGASTFVNDVRTAPGRFNVMEYRGATIIADYGHNPDAISALVAAIDRIPAGRRVVMISAAGDRRDQDIRRQTEILGDAFDEVILYQDACQRGRGDGEVLALLEQGLAGARRARTVAEVRGEMAAIESAFRRLRPGDLGLFLIDQVEPSLEFIGRLLSDDVAPADGREAGKQA